MLIPQDTPAPMTRTVRDASLILDVITGFGPEDPYTVTAANSPKPIGGSYASNLHAAQTISPYYRIGVLVQCFGDDKDPSWHANNVVARKALERLSSAKRERLTLIELEIPVLDDMLLDTDIYQCRSRYYIEQFLAHKPHLQRTSISKIVEEKLFHPALEMFPKIAAGYQSPLEDPLYSSRLEKGGDFQRLVMSTIVANNLDAISFHDIRVPAPLTRDILDDGNLWRTGRTSTNTLIACAAQLPAISIPVGLTEETLLPIGLEFWGMSYQEQKLLEIGYCVEQLIQGRRMPLAPF